MRTASKVLLLVAALGGSALTALPAEAGASTGTWKYSPGEIHAYQRYQRHQAWRAQRPYRGHAYGYYRGPARGYYRHHRYWR